jgi:hypothetical protein
MREWACLNSRSVWAPNAPLADAECADRGVAGAVPPMLGFAFRGLAVHHLLPFFAYLLVTLLGVCPALAERRVALVIGNSDYGHVPRLANPERDAAAMGELFKSAGFDVVEVRRNVGISEMRQALRNFSGLAADADVALVFYAGHGIEVAGNNYLIPVDAALERDVDVEDESVSVDRLLTLLEPAKQLRLIILDACRDNPYAKGMARTLASRSIGRGLARVEPTTPNTLVAYAAKAGSTAEDGRTEHSPFTSALLHHLGTPGLDVRIALGRVHDEVLLKTSRRQEPFVYGALGGATMALVASRGEPETELPTVGAGRLSRDADVSRDYDLAAKIGTRAAWDAFLVRHPSGFLADLAKAQRAKLTIDKGRPEARPAVTNTKPPSTKPSKVSSLPPAERRQERKLAAPKKSDGFARCVAARLARQGGRFVPEGHSTSCVGPDGYMNAPCVKSRSDTYANCAVFRGHPYPN